MKILVGTSKKLTLLLAVSCLLISPFSIADGDVGEHVNHLTDNLANYEQEVNWMIEQVGGVVENYQSANGKAINTEVIVDAWEEVDFHSAVEKNNVPIYASIWQGLYGVKQAVDNKAEIDAVISEMTQLEQALWQGLGAVKTAAQFQDRGLLAKIATTEDAQLSTSETIDLIKTKLDKVVAKYAEQLPEKAIKLVQDTYLNLFEGIEGELIALDADLVEDLEKDFNVTIQKAIQDRGSLDEVRNIVSAMQAKLDKARSLVKDSEKSKKPVF